MDSLYGEIGARMRVCRIARRKTQAQVAEAAGIDASFYGQVERGRNVPSLKTLLAIARALGTDPGELLAHPKRGKPDYLPALEGVMDGLPSRKRRLLLGLVRDMADRLRDS
ncbi:MAG: helix-turn-helix transcriptional regulator [Elusimicrobia bacterium]|nr:helix-turn-helix transcriptional regulator [Elusimicrobiota bacterium]